MALFLLLTSLFFFVFFYKLLLLGFPISFSCPDFHFILVEDQKMQTLTPCPKIDKLASKSRQMEGQRESSSRK